MKRLSVIAVNYNSSSLLKRCLASIVSVRGGLPIEVIVIDNASRREERERLSEVEGDIRFIFKEENRGYSNAVNEGIREAGGDILLITNPDVIYMPYSIERLVEALLSLPNCGAVGPRAWWDDDMLFMLPFSEIVTPFRILKERMMVSSYVIGNAILKAWIRRSLRYWLSGHPLAQEMLSGACIMTTRRIIEEVGGFDETFSLYFEDTDWCLRVRRSGYNLYTVPDARIIHYYNQSARQESELSKEKFRDSSYKYLKKHFKIQLNIARFIRGLFRDGVFDFSYDDMGVVVKPPVVRFDDKRTRLLLLSPNSTLIPSAGAFVDAGSFRINDGLWDLLDSGRYFMRAFELKGLKGCGAWSWIKNE